MPQGPDHPSRQVVQLIRLDALQQHRDAPQPQRRNDLGKV
ncbi:hypothetical protein ABIB26_001281 [Arthrobacter sp. UYEF20]